MKKNKKPAKRTSKASKMANLKQAHGKEEKEEFQPTTLDQIWGDDGTSKYGTMDEEEYQKRLDEMSRTDLEAHSSDIGIVPVEDRTALESRLMKEFVKHTNQYRRPVQNKLQQADISEEAWKILREGR
jgi:hypothetical protein